jgi:hypothetical protein
MKWDVEYTDEFGDWWAGLGGDKTGDGRWYVVHIPLADRLYDEHIEQLQKEGKTHG